MDSFHGLSGIHGVVREDVTVEVECRLHEGVPEVMLDRQWMDVRSDEQARACVSEVVDPHLPR